MSLQSLPPLLEFAAKPSLKLVAESASIKFDTFDVNPYEYLSRQQLDSLASSDRVEYCSLLIPGANGLGNLFENICDRASRAHQILSLSGNPFTALSMAKSVVRRLSPQKAIHIIAHSNGNLNVVPFLVTSLQTLVRRMAWDLVPIKVCRLDPIGIPKSTVVGAAQVIDIGSNKPDSNDLRDRAALSFLRPDFRVRQGIGHYDLLNDTEILDRLIETPYNFF
ncbi:hypothetical protein [Pseudanabaena sp. PCC 6802]|uniref:hypothetical protein n=1 Tax=Pseudanabaena sp. PCC 6802 TaxID=118173 RepID=UPI0003493940|nr:hypothetical protein [Pseudanabaena sp. PCC 6802]